MRKSNKQKTAQLIFITINLLFCLLYSPHYTIAKSYNQLSKKARDLINAVYKPFIDKKQTIVDHHVHVIGVGNSLCKLCPEIENTGIYVNNKRFSLFHPVLFIKTKVLMNSSMIADQDKADAQYARHLFNLAMDVPANTEFYLLAMEGYWERKNPQSPPEMNKEKTDLYIPNEYIVKLADCLNKKMGKNCFVPVISVHPYRPKATEILEKYHKAGVRFVKWLPNIMNIDPRINDSEYSSFYKKMHGLGMALIVHTGWEQALNVIDKKHQKLGYPEYLENALNAGVTVIMSHCGGDKKLKIGCKDSQKSFLEMMNKANKKPEWSLYGETSAITLKKNIPHLVNLLGNENLKNKILYGSDYPLPATYSLYPVNKLIKQGFLSPVLKKPLKEIFDYNPLIFDFVLKRTIKHPRTNKGFPEEAFISLPENISHPQQTTNPR